MCRLTPLQYKNYCLQTIFASCKVDKSTAIKSNANNTKNMTVMINDYDAMVRWCTYKSIKFWVENNAKFGNSYRCWNVGRIDWLIDWLMDRSIDRSMDRSIDWCFTARQLHWLHVHDRMRIKLATIAYKALCTNSPQYLASHIRYHQLDPSAGFLYNFPA